MSNHTGESHSLQDWDVNDNSRETRFEQLQLRRKKMKFRSLFVMFCLVAMPFAAVAQRTRVSGQTEDVTAPPLKIILASTVTQAAEQLAVLLDSRPVIPLGPADILKGYENDMTTVTQRMSAELEGISRAVHTGQLTPAQAEFLIQERYQVAMMQYQVFSALHDALEKDIAQAAPRDSHVSAASDTAIVEVPLPTPTQGTR
jgi:hypothetical protein